MEILQILHLDVKPFLNRLESIFADMDRLYSEAAAHYGFNCHDCKDICCQTRFYHHTYLEYLYVLEGFKSQSSASQSEIEARALNVVQQSAELDRNAKPVRLMCPLNVDKLCILYPYRPMICRLHGIPHELRKSANHPTFGPGCRTFDQCCMGKSYIAFDRTPFYLKLAALENEFKQIAGMTGKIKLTIAEMILSLGP